LESGSELGLGRCSKKIGVGVYDKVDFADGSGASEANLAVLFDSANGGFFELLLSYSLENDRRLYINTESQ